MHRTVHAKNRFQKSKKFQKISENLLTIAKIIKILKFQYVLCVQIRPNSKYC